MDIARADLAHDVRRGLCHVLGYSSPQGKLLRIVRFATILRDCSLHQDSPETALPRGGYLPALARLRFRVCAYHLGSRRPCASAAGLTRAARYSAHRSAATLGEYHSPNCADIRRAAMDIARDVRCGYCTIGGIYTAKVLRAVYLSTHAPPVLGAALDAPSWTSSQPIATAAPAPAEGQCATASAVPQLRPRVPRRRHRGHGPWRIRPRPLCSWYCVALHAVLPQDGKQRERRSVSLPTASHAARQGPQATPGPTSAGKSPISFAAPPALALPGA